MIAAEDPSFYEHEGIDYWAHPARAGHQRLRGRIGPGRWGQGGSTITQQVVKPLVLSPEKTMRRKVQEMILARRLSQQLSKDEILTIYLNHINYGEGHYGCEEASQYFFGKSISEVDLAEAAFLAGVPQRPESHSPHKNPDSAKTRQLYVLRQMVDHGYIDRATADAVALQPIQVLPPSRTDTGHAPEAIGTVNRLLTEKFTAEVLPTLGATVKTTLDLQLQKLARESLERGLEGVDQRQGYRGPAGHLDGPKLEQYRYELALAREMGRGADAARAAADRNKRPLRHALRPIRDSDIFQGVVDRVEKVQTGPGADPGPERAADRRHRRQPGRGRPVGGAPLHRRGPSPGWSIGSSPGDLVRVRLAARTPAGPPTPPRRRGRWRWSWGRKRRWWSWTPGRTRCWRWWAGTTTGPGATIARSGRRASRGRRSSRSSTPPP